MTTHDPSNETLSDYASGAASPGVAILVASHLTYSARSRRAVEDMERMGGALLADEQPAQMSASALDAVLGAIDLPECEGPGPAHRDCGPLPRPLFDVIGRDFSDIPWKFRLPGVAEYVLEGFPGEKVSLLRAKPGSGIPQHTHEGRELTLILAGAMEDDDTVYRVGDVAENDDHDDHKPRIIGDETCYCLVVMDGGLRFTGPFSRALNLLAE